MSSTSSPKRPPSTRKRMILMLIAALLVFGGVFAVKAFFSAQTNNFFDNMPQPAVAVSSAIAKQQRWSDASEAVGTFVAVNGTDVTTEAGGVVQEGAEFLWLPRPHLRTPGGLQLGQRRRVVRDHPPTHGVVQC